MSEHGSWAGEAGLPSRHIAEAALHVAAVIDASGSHALDATESYWHRATGGRFPPAALARGQELLLDVGLLLNDAGVLRPTGALADLVTGSPGDALATLAGRVLEARTDAVSGPVVDALSDLVPDADRRDELLLQLAQRFNDATRLEVGDAGERLVLAEARSELMALGRPDLAREVCRVSLISDQLGYDIRAPRLDGAPRRIEVKATTSVTDDRAVRIFLSRNEAGAGERLPDWALVACLISDRARGHGSLLGWWPHDALAHHLPLDVPTGRWQVAELTLPLASGSPGLPSAVL